MSQTPNLSSHSPHLSSSEAKKGEGHQNTKLSDHCVFKVGKEAAIISFKEELFSIFSTILIQNKSHLFNI